jgi:hypothetical protein
VSSSAGLGEVGLASAGWAHSAGYTCACATVVAATIEAGSIDASAAPYAATSGRLLFLEPKKCRSSEHKSASVTPLLTPFCSSTASHAPPVAHRLLDSTCELAHAVAGGSGTMRRASARLAGAAVADKSASPSLCPDASSLEGTSETTQPQRGRFGTD